MCIGSESIYSQKPTFQAPHVSVPTKNLYFLQHAFVHSPMLKKHGKVSESKISDKLAMCFVMTAFKIHLICKIISLLRLQNRA